MKKNCNLLNYTCQLLIYQSGDNIARVALALQGVFGFG
jgi:hypothetical protein